MLHGETGIERCGTFLPGVGQWRRWRESCFLLELTRHVPSLSVMETDQLLCSFSVNGARHPPFPWPAKGNHFPLPVMKRVALLCVPHRLDTVIQKNIAWLETQMRTEIFSAQLPLQSLLLLCMLRNTQGQTYEKKNAKPHIRHRVLLPRSLSSRVNGTAWTNTHKLHKKLSFPICHFQGISNVNAHKGMLSFMTGLKQSSSN